MYNKYPYTDFSELNLDWFLGQFKELLENWDAQKVDYEQFKLDVTTEFNTLSGKFDNLKETVETFTTFIEHYFDNLDVQQEINNKLDQMALDGSLDALLDPLVTSKVPAAVTAWLNDNVDPVGSAVMIDTSLSIAGAAADAEVVGDHFTADENRIERLEFYTDFNFGPGTKIEIPSGLWPDTDFGIDKFTNGYVPNKLPGDYWTLTGNEWYVSWSDGLDSNTGTDADHPLKTVRKAVSYASAGDTVHIDAGIYDRSNALPSTYSKDLKLIGYGDVFFTAGDNVANLTYTDEGDNTWSTTRASAYNVLDYSSGYPQELVKVSSLDDCKLLANSYYISSNTVYVHCIDNREPDSDIYVLVAVNPNRVDSGKTLYAKNIHFDGGTEAFKSTGGFLLAENCIFEFGRANGMALEGCASYLYGCIATHNKRDGFNYHADSNNNVCQAIEVNCRGYYNGIFDDNNNNNGSTIHDGSSIIRLSCNYWNNKGPNIADVNANTKSFNVACKCSNSAGAPNGYQADFQADGGCRMYLIDCQASDSETSVKVTNASTMVVDSVIYNGAKDVRTGCYYISYLG